MIKINLLPGAERQKSGGGGGGGGGSATNGFPLFLLLIVAALGGVGFYAYSTYEKEQASFAKVAATEKKLADTKKTIQELKKKYDELADLADRINAQFAIVQALASPDRRLFWSEKINMLAALRMQLAVYVTRLELQEDIEDRETPESVARRENWRADKNPNKGPEPKPLKVPIIKQRLIISAIAYGTDSPQRLRQIRNFIEELRTFKWKRRRSGEEVAFIDKLDPNFDIGNQKIDTVAEVEVSRFSVTIRAIEQTVDSKEFISPLSTAAIPAAGVAATAAVPARGTRQ